MLMPKKDRIAIYELLFKEGVMVAKKDVHMPKHPELSDKNVPNLHVMKAMQSLKSRGYVKEQFAWRHFYWYLTNEGIQYLRDFLHLPPEIVPATLRRSRPETGRPRPKGLEGERPARLSRGETDRDTYRRSAAPPGADKKAEAGAGAATEFQFGYMNLPSSDHFNSTTVLGRKNGIPGEKWRQIPEDCSASAPGLLNSHCKCTWRSLLIGRSRQLLWDVYCRAHRRKSVLQTDATLEKQLFPVPLRGAVMGSEKYRYR
ncbi:unnamed protein product [Ranitomeya imitator]|uniref:Plectin/eS10 N-terminal domain-containing protein n=1 Tax=Ranitomeya imitator TaxID=111125 RepID=A0ABN9LRY4_9NEOB|nr:unnamed protein product [Ranitomeya imitator]